MISKSLQKLMKDIKNGVPIDLTKFKAELNRPKNQIQFEAEEISCYKPVHDVNKYVVTLSERLTTLIERLLSESGTDRISAAHQNRSHSHKVGGSYLLLRRLSQHPSIVLFDCSGFSTEYYQSETAIIVENRQLFIHADKTFRAAKMEMSIPTYPEMDMVFGAGNEICNSLHKEFLSKYKKLYLCFDCDLGGMTTANNVYNLLPETEMCISFPSDLQKRLENVVVPASIETLNKIAQLGAVSSFVRPFTTLIFQTRKTIEQESFIND